MSNADDLKRQAAARALELVTPGMRLGLGTGSTATHFVALLGERVAQGLKIVGVPTSERTRAQAESLAIPLADLDTVQRLDLTVDGTDEFDPALRLIKGGGGALLREKIVAAASQRMIVITDASKAVTTLGRFPLPVEVNRFGVEATRHLVARQSAWPAATGNPPAHRRRGHALRDRWRALYFRLRLRGHSGAGGSRSAAHRHSGCRRARAVSRPGQRCYLRRGRRRCGLWEPGLMADYDVDLFVIGAGSGGVRAARIAAGYGAKVMLAEEYRVGGTCVIRGCVPKKLMVYASRFADAFADAVGFGWTARRGRVRLGKLVAAKEQGDHAAVGDLSRQSRKGWRCARRKPRGGRGGA